MFKKYSELYQKVVCQESGKWSFNQEVDDKPRINSQQSKTTRSG